MFIAVLFTVANIGKQVSIYRNKMCYLYNRILHSLTKEGSPVICNTMDDILNVWKTLR